MNTTEDVTLTTAIQLHTYQTRGLIKMDQEQKILYCEEGCGHFVMIQSIALPGKEVGKINIETDCEVCGEMTEHIEDLTVEVSFKCTGCDNQKDAFINPVRGQAKTHQHCGECGNETVWHEVGLRTIQTT